LMVLLIIQLQLVLTMVNHVRSSIGADDSTGIHLTMLSSFLKQVEEIVIHRQIGEMEQRI